MRFGIGGGVGPVGGGVSVKGSELGGGCGCFVVALVAALSLVWPYSLGAWLAVKAGAGNPSTARGVTGWVFEGIWLVTLAVFAISWTIRRRARVRSQRREAIVDALDQFKRLLEDIQQHPSGRTTAALPAGERILAEFSDVKLIEPRVRERGGPKVPTVVDEGDLRITSRAVRYRSHVRTAEWRIDKLIEIGRSEYVVLPVSNRKTVSGVLAPDHLGPAVIASIEWARQLSLGANSLSGILRELQQAVQAMEQQINNRPD
ncbi:hypothetical protein AB0L70_15330 [Kribbella sp. NPDC051952]|uniref:hypothetical protein n=1 Tax=Kribbella sp. NPDC051952 TaxID=3154851 RepID=UPI0034315108